MTNASPASDEALGGNTPSPSVSPAATDNPTNGLLPQHAQLLRDSKLSKWTVLTRGYRSVTDAAELAELKFAKAACNVPGLLIPLLRKDGSTWGVQYRPDEPRLDIKGKPLKYESPSRQAGTKQRNGIDVPPRVGAKLDDPTVELWITEGSRKADSAVFNAGLACVAILGVWGWLGTNGKGGKTALPDWRDIALNGREIVLAFDSDVVHKPSVHQALDGLAGYLESKGAGVQFCHFPPGDDGGKTGLDDYFAAGHSPRELRELVSAEMPAITEDGKRVGLARRARRGRKNVAYAADLAAKSSSTKSTPPTPKPEPFTGNAAALLDAMHAFLCTYVAFPSKAAAVAVTLWAAHTHLVESFEATPRLALLSPEKQCGKTRVLELLELLCAVGRIISDASAPYLFRRIGAGPVTILLDEADAIWKRGKADDTAEALRSIVNAGHRKNATVGRVEMTGQGAELREFRVFAPVAVAGIGNHLPETVLDRSVIVSMRRRAPDEKIKGYRERTARPEGEALGNRLGSWAFTVADKVGDPWPEMPPGVTDRPADVWEPLLAVAELAGGDWPKRAREACVEFVTGSRDDTASIGVRLLTDLLAVFHDDKVPALSTETVLDKLHDIEEAPWADWYGRPLDARGLAKMLKPYGIKSGTVRIGEETAKGYRREDLWDAWKRYGVLGQGVSDTSVTSVTPQVSTVTEDKTDTSHPSQGPLDGKDGGEGVCPDMKRPPTPRSVTRVTRVTL
jgi:Protein of unknown function (DUF3631)/Domain of unknown function (DUF3854)